MLLNCGIGEDSWESLGQLGDQTVNPKGNQSWIFIGRTDAEAEVPILWPLHAKSWLIRKDPDAGKDWNQEEKGMTEDKMVGWQHQLNGHEFEQAPGDSEGQGSLACCNLWGHKELDRIEQLNDMDCSLQGFSVHGIANSWTWLSNWTATNDLSHFSSQIWLTFIFISS